MFVSHTCILNLHFFALIYNFLSHNHNIISLPLDTLEPLALECFPRTRRSRECPQWCGK